MLSVYQRSRTLGSALSLLLCVAACNTLPEEEDDPTRSLGTGISLTGIDAPDRLLVPAINGVLMRDGQIMPNTRVLLARNQGIDSNCEEPLATTQSDQKGGFAFDAVTAKLSLREVFGNLEINWQVCIEENASTQQTSTDQSTRMIWFDQHTGALFSSEPTVLLCELGTTEGSGSAHSKRLTGDASGLACRSVSAESDSPIQLDSIN